MIIKMVKDHKTIRGIKLKSGSQVRVRDWLGNELIAAGKAVKLDRDLTDREIEIARIRASMDKAEEEDN
jgi:hypothetical protein